MTEEKPFAQVIRDTCAKLAEAAKEAPPCVRCGCRLKLVTSIGAFCPGCGALRGNA